MRPSIGTYRKVMHIFFTVALSIALAACGGGGGTGSTPPGVSGPATVAFSVASAPDFPAGTTFSAPATSAVVTDAPVSTPPFDNVFVSVTRLALIPSGGPEYPDRDGEPEMMNDSAENGKSGMRGFVTIDLPSPVVIDLLHPPTGRQVAKLLNKFSEVPAGEYSKIRVYYESVVGHTAGPPENNTEFHPTAHYHFDVHFVGGNLVIPVTAPQDGIRFYSIVIKVVGLKYHQAGNSGNVLLRPQIFATVEPTKYIVHGVAEQVNHSARTFNVITEGSDNVHTAYNTGTGWSYVDGRFVDPSPLPGAEALQDGAVVDVIGSFQSGVLVAEEVDITFPSAIRDKKVYLGWNPADNTIALRFAGDNVVSVPNDRRDAAYYDNAVFPYGRLTDGDIQDNVFITARGYATAIGIKAYWISIGFVGP